MAEFHKALNYAYMLLRYRARAQQELIDRLSKKKFSPEVVKAVINRLHEQGYLNDEDFIAQFIREKIERGYGPNKIRYQLFRLGLSEEAVECQLAAVPLEVYHEKIRVHIQKKQLQNTGKESLPKLYRFLIQKGFNGKDIFAVIYENGCFTKKVY